MTSEQAKQAFVEEGGSLLFNPLKVRLLFATQEEVEGCRQRLIRRFPGSEDVWLINLESTAEDFAGVQESMSFQEE